jgi:hypothetical protein
MYYGGDLVEIALTVTLAVQWYNVTGRVHVRQPLSTTSAVSAER